MKVKLAESKVEFQGLATETQYIQPGDESVKRMDRFTLRSINCHHLATLRSEDESCRGLVGA